MGISAMNVFSGCCCCCCCCFYYVAERRLFFISQEDPIPTRHRYWSDSGQSPLFQRHGASPAGRRRCRLLRGPFRVTEAARKKKRERIAFREMRICLQISWRVCWKGSEELMVAGILEGVGWFVMLKLMLIFVLLKKIYYGVRNPNYFFFAVFLIYCARGGVGSLTVINHYAHRTFRCENCVQNIVWLWLVVDTL